MGVIQKILSIRSSLSISAHRLQTEGVTGDDIAAFQRLFNRRAHRYGIYINETAVYDPQTIVGVRTYQRRALNIGNGDGFVGPMTAQRLRIQLEE